MVMQLPVFHFICVLVLVSHVYKTPQEAQQPPWGLMENGNEHNRRYIVVKILQLKSIHENLVLHQVSIPNTVTPQWPWSVKLFQSHASIHSFALICCVVFLIMQVVYISRHKLTIDCLKLILECFSRKTQRLFKKDWELYGLYTLQLVLVKGFA